jgi:hypothetical protein
MTPFSRVVAWMAFVMAVLVFGFGKTTASSVLYYPAYFGQMPSRPLLLVFPSAGPKIAIPLPEGLPGDFRPIAFAPDGRALYGQRNDPNADEGLIQIEFNPINKTVVPGSEGFHTIWFVSGPLPSGRLIVSGWSKTLGRGECGAYEIDPKTGQSDAMLIGTHPSCGGGAGVVSPDSRRLLTYSSGELRVVDLVTGTSELIGKAGGFGAWSPDGRWLAGFLERAGSRELVLIDAVNFAKRRGLGIAPANGRPVWSPDSKELLVERSQSRCGDLLSSLEVVNVESGRRTPVPSSKCEIYTGIAGWVDGSVIP